MMFINKVGQVIEVLYQFEEHGSIEKLCVYYLNCFKKPLNYKGQFINEIIKKQKYTERLIMSINQPKNKPKSILKNSIDLKNNSFFQNKKTKSCILKSKKEIRFKDYGIYNYFINKRFIR